MNKEIRIVIADDHPIVRTGLRTVIDADPLLQVLAEADNGEAALASIVELQPDVVVLDINGARAYVTNAGVDNVSVIDTVTNTVIATVPVGTTPVAVAVTPTGAFAYVVNGTGTSGEVTVLDTTTNTVVTTIPVGVNPLGIAITPLKGRIRERSPSQKQTKRKSFIDPTLRLQ